MTLIYWNMISDNLVGKAVIIKIWVWDHELGVCFNKEAKMRRYVRCSASVRESSSIHWTLGHMFSLKQTTKNYLVQSITHI